MEKIKMKEEIVRPIGTELSEPIRTLGSFPDKMEKAKEVNFFYDLRGKASKSLLDQPGDTLKSDKDSSDEIVLDTINKSDNDNLNQLILDFNQLDKNDIFGNPIAKRLIIEIINIVKEPEFRKSDKGRLIFEAYKELARNSNINVLELAGKLVYKEDQIQNIVFYLTFGCDLNVIDLYGLSKNINEILSCTHVVLNTTVLENNTIDVINNDFNTEISESAKKANDEIVRIEESKKSLFAKMGKGLWKGLKWTLAGNKAIAGIQITLYTVGLGVAGKFAVPLIMGVLSKQKFSETKQIDVGTSEKINVIEKESGISTDRFENSDSEDTISKAFAEFLIKVAKIITSKK